MLSLGTPTIAVEGDSVKRAVDALADWCSLHIFRRSTGDSSAAEAKMTKHELVTELSKRLSLSRSKALAVVDTLFGSSGILAAELRRGGRVQITGFGHFETKTRAARNGRDPRTGRTIAIKASTAPVFRPGQPLRDLLNKKR